MKTCLMLFFILLNFHVAFSQDILRCGTITPDTIPDINLYKYQNEKLLRSQAVCIPVVVHVVYHLSNQNISDSQILSQINVLNEDFRRMPNTPGFNNNLIGSDTRYEFRLSDRDPNGSSTIGITRHYSVKTEFDNRSESDKQVLRNFAYWDPSKYLNIWVVPVPTSGGNPVLGYVTKFPWESGATDGIVVGHNYFGDNVGTAVMSPYSFGRTTTHEAGHYLGLLHTFQGGCLNSNCSNQGDHVCDTPPVAQPNYSCIIINSCHTDQPDLNDMIENYMDYTNDACMNIFTVGQTNRMDYYFDTYRPSIVNSNGLSNNDFVIFGNHVGNYEYNVTTRIITNPDVLHDELSITTGSSVTMRAKNEIIIKSGFTAHSGSNFHAFIDDTGLPPFPKINQIIDNSEITRKNIINIHPNPYTDNVRISITLSNSEIITLSVYDVLGNRITSLADMSELSVGSHDFTFLARNIKSGVYYVVMSSSTERITRPLLLIK